MRKTIKPALAIAAGAVATCATIALCIWGAIYLFAWWLFTGVFLETDAERLEIPKPPLVFSQYTHQAVYAGYRYDCDENMEYNEYYYHWKKASFDRCPGYQPVTGANTPEILNFVRNYEGHLDKIKERNHEDGDKLCRKYRYDPDSLSQGDYYRVELWNSEDPYSNYELCIFDHETNTLYFMSYR